MSYIAPSSCATPHVRDTSAIGEQEAKAMIIPFGRRRAAREKLESSIVNSLFSCTSWTLFIARMPYLTEKDPLGSVTMSPFNHDVTMTFVCELGRSSRLIGLR